jgi:hypothetical protein
MEWPLPKPASSRWPPYNTTMWGNTELFPKVGTAAPRSSQVRLPFCWRLLSASFAHVSLSFSFCSLLPLWCHCHYGPSAHALFLGIYSKNQSAWVSLNHSPVLKEHSSCLGSCFLVFIQSHGEAGKCWLLVIHNLDSFPSLNILLEHLKKLFQNLSSVCRGVT